MTAFDTGRYKCDIIMLSQPKKQNASRRAFPEARRPVRRSAAAEGPFGARTSAWRRAGESHRQQQRWHSLAEAAAERAAGWAHPCIVTRTEFRLWRQAAGLETGRA
ncbi:hypothetical protein CIHG_04443 [Coccidioides immitis H538.4]|uniref:Uncharacterized protein n=1 Tax=Coccidioides immitis H538.4 TaxID=396776 RepID=A0A0J8RRT3_COCIT|nr:hypothetical protein CIHG_04443 [Coccidioides immitis H538.4]